MLLIKTVKGDGMGADVAGTNTVHQKKNLNPEERLARAREFGIPLDDRLVMVAMLPGLVAIAAAAIIKDRRSGRHP